MRTARLEILAASLIAAAAAHDAVAQQPKPDPGCGAVPDHGKLRAALQAVVKEGHDANSGMGNEEWAAVVNRDGIVCAVAYSGPDRSVEWPGSRVVAAEKASTANALSGPNYALSTANLYAPSQPGQSLYGVVTSAPPNPQAAYAGPATKFGQPDDPMVGKAIGGMVVFGGGLALYDAHGKIVGGLGVSGDTACADHVVAWKVRHQLGLDAVPMGPSPAKNDDMIRDFESGQSASGFGHPTCKGGTAPDEILKKLSQQYRTGPKR